MDYGEPHRLWSWYGIPNTNASSAAPDPERTARVGGAEGDASVEDSPRCATARRLVHGTAPGQRSLLWFWFGDPGKYPKWQRLGGGARGIEKDRP